MNVKYLIVYIKDSIMLMQAYFAYYKLNSYIKKGAIYEKKNSDICKGYS